jgi:hypothetical protein
MKLKKKYEQVVNGSISCPNRDKLTADLLKSVMQKDNRTCMGNTKIILLAEKFPNVEKN